MTSFLTNDLFDPFAGDAAVAARVSVAAERWAHSALTAIRRVLTVVRWIAYTLTILLLLAGALLAWLAPTALVAAAGGVPAAAQPSALASVPVAPPSADVEDTFTFVPGGSSVPPAGVAAPVVGYDTGGLWQQQQLPPIIPIGPTITPFNAEQIKRQIVALITQGLEYTAASLRAPLDALLASPLNFLSQTPPAASYDNRVVTDLWQTVRRAAFALLVLIVVAGGLNVLVKDRIGAPYHEAAEFLARVPVGAALASASLWLVQLPIDLNNALCGVIDGGVLPGWEYLGQAPQLGGVRQEAIHTIGGLVYLVICLALVLQMLIRLALIDVLIVVSPLALLCWVLPQTQGWARQWSSTFTAAVFTQLLQVVALKLGGRLFTGDLAPGIDDGLLAILLSISMLILTIRLPEMLRASYAGGGSGLVRFITYTKIASVVRGGR